MYRPATSRPIVLGYISQGLGKSVLLETCDQPGRNHGTQLTVRQNKGEFWCYGQTIQSKPFPKPGNVSRVVGAYRSTVGYRPTSSHKVHRLP